jgi:hypothetical protein
MTTCGICGESCTGSDATSNPFCLRCVLLNFGGNETALWELDMAASRDRHREATPAELRLLEQVLQGVSREGRL